MRIPRGRLRGGQSHTSSLGAAGNRIRHELQLLLSEWTVPHSNLATAVAAHRTGGRDGVPGHLFLRLARALQTLTTVRLLCDGDPERLTLGVAAEVALSSDGVARVRVAAATETAPGVGNRQPNRNPPLRVAVPLPGGQSRQVRDGDVRGPEETISVEHGGNETAAVDASTDSIPVYGADRGASVVWRSRLTSGFEAM